MKSNIKGKLIYTVTIIAKMVKEWKIFIESFLYHTTANKWTLHDHNKVKI